MTRYGTVLYRCRPFTDRDSIFDLTQAIAFEAGVFGTANRAFSPSWGAHPCCFDPREDIDGMALAAGDVRPLILPEELISEPRQTGDTQEIMP